MGVGNVIVRSAARRRPAAVVVALVLGLGQGPVASAELDVPGARWEEGAIGFRGVAHLPAFPCGPICTGGAFVGDWTGTVRGSFDGVDYEVTWITTHDSGVRAAFQYSEACNSGLDTLAGEADGSGSAEAAGSRGQVLGSWGGRAVLHLRMSFDFHWARTGTAAVVALAPVSLTLDVAGIGYRTVAIGARTGTATFVITSADNVDVPTCSTPLTNVRAAVAGAVPLRQIG